MKSIVVVALLILTEVADINGQNANVDVNSNGGVGAKIGGHAGGSGLPGSLPRFGIRTGGSVSGAVGFGR